MFKPLYATFCSGMQNARLGHEIAFFTSKSDMLSPHVADLIRDGESMITWWEALLLCCFIGWIIENRIDKVTEAIEKLGKDLHADIKDLTGIIERKGN
jgi:hypothetical protein